MRIHTRNLTSLGVDSGNFGEYCPGPSGPLRQVTSDITFFGSLVDFSVENTYSLIAFGNDGALKISPIMRVERGIVPQVEKRVAQRKRDSRCS
jgi:hypothetical protein